MTIREYEFNVTTETASVPSVGTPADSSDLITKSYFDANAAGGGAGVGGINYIDNFDFESTEDGEIPTGWLVYKDAAQEKPENGTAGSASITFLAEDTLPSIGSRKAVFTKGGSNLQGEGVGYNFTIDRQFTENPQTFKVEFYYDASANFDFGDGTIDDVSDVTVWIYDVDGSELIELDNYLLDGSGFFRGYFQPNSSNNDYRLIIHCATTNASAYTLDIDNVIVGPANKSFGSIITEWREFTPTVSNDTNTNSNAGIWRRVGDSMELRGYIAWDGAGAGTNWNVTIPDGLVISSESNGDEVKGNGFFNDSGTFTSTSVVKLSSTTIRFAKDGGTIFVGSDAGSGDTLSYSATIPIQGWGGTTQVANDASGRLVAFKAFANGAQSGIADNVSTAIEFAGTTEGDTHNAWDGTDTYTVPVSGWYSISSSIIETSVDIIENFLCRLFVEVNSVQEDIIFYNGSGVTSATADIGIQGTTIKKLNAGDEIKILGRIDTNGVLWVPSSDSYVAIHMIQGPASIAPGEIVAARATGISGGNQTITAGAAAATISHDIEVVDTHGALTSGVFTCPVAGQYNVSASYRYNTGGTPPSNYQLNIDHNGGTIAGLYNTDTIGNESYSKFTNTLVNAVAGDTIEMSVQCSGQDITMVNSEFTALNIHRVGGAY